MQLVVVYSPASKEFRKMPWTLFIVFNVNCILNEICNVNCIINEICNVNYLFPRE